MDIEEFKLQALRKMDEVSDKIRAVEALVKDIPIDFEMVIGDKILGCGLIHVGESVQRRLYLVSNGLKMPAIFYPHLDGFMEEFMKEFCRKLGIKGDFISKKE